MLTFHFWEQRQIDELMRDLYPRFRIEKSLLLRAMAHALSHGIPADEPGDKYIYGCALVPFFEFVNHSEEVDVNCVHNEKDDSSYYELRDTMEMDVDEQVAYCYRCGSQPLSRCGSNCHDASPVDVGLHLVGQVFVVCFR